MELSRPRINMAAVAYLKLFSSHMQDALKYQKCMRSLRSHGKYTVELFFRIVTLRMHVFESRWILLRTPFQRFLLLNLIILTNLLC